MTNNDDPNQFDLFSPYMGDLRLRDQRDTMERPFFSLSKHKRMKPILYKGPNGKDYVEVQPSIKHGMATIFDADILIWLSSVLGEMKDGGVNDIPRIIAFHPLELLKGIGRSWGGRSYNQLEDALDRLAQTSIKTNILHTDRSTSEVASFHWINSWKKVSSTDGKYIGMEVELSQWVYDGVLKDGGLLSIDDEYFDIVGGRARWLYRVARKHAGGNEAVGFTINLETLFDKSGSDGRYSDFKHEIKKLCVVGHLLDFHIAWVDDTQGREPSIWMVRRSKLAKDHPCYQPAKIKDKRLPVINADGKISRRRRPIKRPNDKV
jgi:plasmid replication initiation protein